MISRILGDFAESSPIIPDSKIKLIANRMLTLQNKMMAGSTVYQDLKKSLLRGRFERDLYGAFFIS
jgi:hypothetical protein|tara:strand:- start:125 stop:322 length:198 start_codon:yes stop_codon:yes gene_type:complete